MRVVVGVPHVPDVRGAVRRVVRVCSGGRSTGCRASTGGSGPARRRSREAVQVVADAPVAGRAPPASPSQLAPDVLVVADPHTRLGCGISRNLFVGLGVAARHHRTSERGCLAQDEKGDGPLRFHPLAAYLDALVGAVRQHAHQSGDQDQPDRRRRWNPRWYQVRLFAGHVDDPAGERTEQGGYGESQPWCGSDRTSRWWRSQCSVALDHEIVPPRDTCIGDRSSKIGHRALAGKSFARGSISAQGTRTKPRSCASGCGSVMSAWSLLASPTTIRSTSRVRGPQRSPLRTRRRLQPRRPARAAFVAPAWSWRR